MLRCMAAPCTGVCLSSAVPVVAFSADTAASVLTASAALPGLMTHTALVRL